MSEKQNYVVKQLESLDSVRSTCGFKRSLFDGTDSDALSLSVLNINDSTKHYHEKITEIYYCISGDGALELDDDEVPLSQGTAVLVPPGIRHSAKGDVQVLIICSPPFETEDMFVD